jgi:hypothetical protein
MNSQGGYEVCPCGSGRRYRDCCGRDAAVGSARDSALTKLLAFAFQPAFDSDHTVAETIFWGSFLRDAEAHQVRWLIDSEDATVKYNSWFLFDWEVDHHGTVADMFLEEEGAGLNPAERAILGRMADAHLRVYEVEAVQRGEGLHLLDLWSGSRVFVVEHTASQRIVRWDLLGARVASDGFGGLVFEGGLYQYPAEARQELVSHFRRLHRRHQRKFPGDDSRAFFRRHGMAFHHMWLRLVAFPEPAKVVTAEGDPLLFCRAVFDACDAAALDALWAEMAASPEIEQDDEGRLIWRERTGAGLRQAGTWTRSGERLVLEAGSKERAARGRAWVEAFAAGRVRYRATAIETVDQTIEALRQPPASRFALPSHPDAGPVRELYDRHYAGWLDRPLSALGNRTPRAAARTRLWRGRLVDLLKQLENRAERASLHGRPEYDFAWIWRELGLERPEAGLS